MIKRLLPLLLLLIATPAWAINNCSITGQILNPDSTPLANGAVSFNSVRPQVIQSTTIAAKYVSTKTDASGNMTAISLPQGLVVQITICKSGGCGAPFTAIIPVMAASPFGNLSQGTILSGGPAIVSGITSTGPTSITGNSTDGSDQISGVNVNNQFNVMTFGAKGNGSNCDDVGIQAAIEAACAVSPAQVYFPRPASYYRVCAPIFIDCNNVRLTGDTYQGTGNTAPERAAFLSNIQASFNGPIFVMKNGGAGIDLDTPLITNSVHSAKFDATTESYYVNLNDVPSTIAGPVTINGLSAVTVQAYFKLTNTADGIVVASAGNQYPGAASNNFAYLIWINGGQFQAAFTVNGVAMSVITDSVDTPTVGVLYHTALVLDPNGGASVLRFFVQGISRGTVAYGAAKTAVQNNWATAAIGCGNNSVNYTECQIDVAGPIRGSIDGVEIAKTARYTGAFTPTYAEPVADSNTLVKASFDVNDRILTQVTIGASTTMWIPVRRISEPGPANVPSTSAIEMDHLSVAANGGFHSIGLFAPFAIVNNFHDLSFSSMYEGIDIWDTSFENRFDNIWIKAGGANGYYGIKDDGGIDYFGFGRVDGFPFQFVGRGGSYVLNNFFTQGEADTIWTYIFTGNGAASNTADVVCTQCESDQENSGTTYQGTFFLNGVGTVKLIGGSAISSSTTTPAIQIAKVGTGSIDGMGFTAIAGAPPEFIHVLAGNVISPLQLINPNQFGGTVPWSDSPQDITLINGNTNTYGAAAKATIDNISVNGTVNPAAYGVISSSNTTGTGTISTGTKALTLSAAGDWVNGEGIAIPKAGANSALTAAAQPVVVATCPGGACATGYTYQARAIDAKCGSATESAASVSVNNNASLDATHFNMVTITPVAGVQTYAVYAGTRLAGVVINSIGTATAAQEFKDVGATLATNSVCIPSAPAAAIPDALYTTIVSGAGTTALTLTAAAGNTATSQTVYHDDAFAINAAIATFGASTGGVAKFPSGKQFTVSQPIVIGAANTAPTEPQLVGDGSAPPHLQATALMQGEPVIKIYNAFKPRVSNLVIAGTSGAPPIAGIELRVNNPASSPVNGGYVGEANIENVSMDSYAPTNCVAITAAPTYDLNNSEDTIRNLTCNNAPHAGIYLGMINALDEHIEGGNISGADAAIYLNGGSFDVEGSSLSTGAAGWAFNFASGSYQHSSSVSNPHFITGGGLVTIAAADTGQPVALDIVAADSDVAFAGNSDTNMVEMLGTNRFGLSISSSMIGQDGVTNVNWVLNSASRNVMLLGDHIAGVSAFSGNTNVTAYGNHFSGGCPTSTLSGFWLGAGNVGDSGALCTDFTNNLTLNAATISTLLTWTQGKSAYQTLTSASNATPVNAALGDNCFENLGEATLIGAPTNPVDGQTLTFLFTNDATPRVVTWNAIYHVVGGNPAGNPTITASKDSVIAFKYNATKTQWNEISRSLNE